LANFNAGLAFATGGAANALLTIHCARKNSSNGGFAHTAGAGEQIGMVKALVI
jgi:hypothetical protein